MDSNVNIKIEALDNSKAAFASVAKNIEQVSSVTGKATRRLEDMAPTFRKVALAGTAAFAGIAAASTKSIQAYAEVERAQRQLENTVLNVSKGTKAQVKEIENLVNALEKKAGVDADSLKIGVAQLSTFGLSTDAVIGLTKSLADLTVNQSGLNATSDDYISSANNIAKALNGQFAILEKSGIRFTQAQKDLITYGTEAQKVAALQEGFNQNLRETTDTVEGTDLAMAKLSRTTENITENLGKALAPAFASVAEKIQPIIERFAEWAEQNPETLGNIVLIGGAVSALAVALGAVGLALPPLIAALALLAGPVGIITAILGGLAFAVWKVVQIFQVLRDDGGLIWKGITVMMKDAVDFILKYTIDPLIAGFEKVLKYIQKVRDGIKSIGGKVGSFTSGIGSSVSSLISKVTPFAEGGIVTGPTLGLVGEAGPEAIIPLSRAASFPGIGGGITVNITGNSFMGERDMAEKVGDQIIRLLKQNQRL
jgi:hypothetical protein